MSTPLTPLPLIGAAFNGLNKQLEAQVGHIGPEWALELQNAVFDEQGRISSRKGWVDQTTTPVSGTPDMEVLFEYYQADESTSIIAAADDSLWESTDGGDTWTDRTGSLSYTGNDWKLLNFNNKVIGFKFGEDPIVKTTGTFAAIVETTGSAPTGGVALSAFGRVWAVDQDGVTVQYSGLLDETDWDSETSILGAGAVDLTNVWTLGQDTVVGLAAFGANLVIFGTRHIIIYSDAAGSVTAIDPATMYVADTIERTGLVSGAQDTIVNIGQGDLWYLSPNGVQSLARVLQDRNNPLVSISEQIHDYLRAFVQTETDTTKIRAEFDEDEEFYLLILPFNKRQFAFATNFIMQNGAARTTEWFAANMLPKSALKRRNGSLLFGFEGVVGRYTGSQDDDQTYRFVYHSPHLDMGPEAHMRHKILKTIGTIVFVSTAVNLIYKWGFDFKGIDTFTRQKALDGALVAEWGISEWGSNGSLDPNNSDLTAGVDVSEWGASARLRILNVPASGEGQFIQVGLEVDVTNSAFALQEITLFPRLGRMANYVEN